VTLAVAVASDGLQGLKRRGPSAAIVRLIVALTGAIRPALATHPTPV
jgi:hypothetical protein